MSGRAPAITIGLPVQNGERYLRSAIDSLLRQTFQDFELIVADNASDDQTEKICREYAERDVRVLYLRHRVNRGANFNFNCLVDKAHGSYFKWAAHDDLCSPDSLDACREGLDTDPDAVLSFPKTVLIDPHGTEVGEYDDRLNLGAPSPLQRYARFSRDSGLCNVAFGLMRISALRRTRLLQDFVGADGVLFAELALLGQFRQVVRGTFFRRIHKEMYSDLHRTSQERFRWVHPRLPPPRFIIERPRMAWEHYQMLARQPGLSKKQKVAAGFLYTGMKLRNALTSARARAKARMTYFLEREHIFP